MKTARRLLSALLALLMVFAFVACDGGEETPTDSVSSSTTGGNVDASTNTGSVTDTSSNSTFVPPEEDTTFEQPDAPLDEMSGKTYIILQHASVDNPFGYKQDSLMGEYVVTRLTEVMEKYSCQIDFGQLAYDTELVSKLQSYMYMPNSGDLFFADKNAMLRQALGTGGDTSLMEDLLVVDNIINFWDINKWGNITAREAMMAGGTFYGVSPALWIDCTPLPYYTVVYNKDIVETFGLDDLQEYWEREEWDRDTMLNVITECYDPTASEGLWGMTAPLGHMMANTLMTTGCQMLDITKINADDTVEWTPGLDNLDAVEGLTWLKNTLNTSGKHFNNGQANWASWEQHIPFIEGRCAMVSTRPIDLFGSIVSEADEFGWGIITWAGAEANTVVGYYEQVYTVAIPRFAQDIEHSAFLMYDLFEGLEGVKSYSDVVDYYASKYFESELDVELLFRTDATVQYSYWPNGLGLFPIEGKDFNMASSMSALVNSAAHSQDHLIEEHVIPNKVALEKYRQAGYFD